MPSLNTTKIDSLYTGNVVSGTRSECMCGAGGSSSVRLLRLLDDVAHRVALARLGNGRRGSLRDGLRGGGRLGDGDGDRGGDCGGLGAVRRRGNVGDDWV